MKRLVKLLFAVYIITVVFLGLSNISYGTATISHCPDTWAECTDVRCWDRTGTPSEGCCIQTHASGCDSLYSDCLNGYCW